jgi:hypothetical protein
VHPATVTGDLDRRVADALAPLRPKGAVRRRGFKVNLVVGRRSSGADKKILFGRVSDLERAVR